MKTISKFIIGIMCLVSYSVSAETRVGLGTSVNTLISFSGSSILSSAGLIYLPIRMKSFMLEPYLIYQKYEDDGEFVVKDTTKGLGVGAFYVAPITKSFGYYLGGRLAWTETDATFSDNSVTSESNREAWVVSPLIGVEYGLEDTLFIAVEAGVGFQDGEENEVDYKNEPSKENYKSIGTFSNIMLRIMF